MGGSVFPAGFSGKFAFFFLLLFFFSWDVLQIWTEQGWGALEGSLWILQTHPGAGENGSGEREGEPWRGAGSEIPPGKTLLALQVKKKLKIKKSDFRGFGNFFHVAPELPVGNWGTTPS